MIMPPGKPYDGFQKKLIIAFDVGATFSGVSYVVLIPRELPLIQGVKVGGDCKIPSVVYYDGTGNVVAIGSETKLTRILILNLRKSRVLWRLNGSMPSPYQQASLLKMIYRFKLHLRPPHLAAEQGFVIKDIPALLPNKRVIDIFSDLLRYLYQCTFDNNWEMICGNLSAAIWTLSSVTQRLGREPTI